MRSTWRRSGVRERHDDEPRRCDEARGEEELHRQTKRKKRRSSRLLEAPTSAARAALPLPRLWLCQSLMSLAVALQPPQPQ